MRYYDDMDSKSGFNDGNSIPPDADECREVYVEVINILAAKHKSKLRVVSFDRPGFHNHCLILRVFAEDLEGLHRYSSADLLRHFANQEPPPDEGLLEALYEAENLDLDSFVETKAVVNRKNLRKLLQSIAGPDDTATGPDKSFVLTGDITRAAKVRAKGISKAAAILSAENGNFEILEEFKGSEEFRLDAEDSDHVEEEN